MPTRQPRAGNSPGAAVLDSPNYERERIFDAFRQYGYLEADLDPLGFLQPVPQPDLQIEGEFAQEARAAYCGSAGAGFRGDWKVRSPKWIRSARSIC